MQTPLFQVARILILLLLPVVWSEPSGTCVPWTGVCPACNVPVGTPIFIPSGFTADDIFISTQRGSNGLAFVRTPEPCYSTAIETICSTTLRPCLQLANNVTLPYPQETCKSVCTRFVEQCTGPFAAAGVPLYSFAFWASLTNSSDPLNVTCEERDEWVDEVLLFPTVGTNYTINGTVYEQPCMDVDVQVDVTCQSPLGAEGGLYCSFVCPLPSLTNSQYDSAQIMQDIVSWISWVASAFLLISFLVNPHMQRLPKGLILPTVIGANVLAGGMVLPSLAGYDNIWCGGSDVTVLPESYFYRIGNFGYLGVNSSTSSLTFHSSACSFQGAILLFGFLTCTLWWTITAFNMFLEIYFGNYLKPKYNWIRVAAYNLIGWVIPFLFMLIPTSAGAMGLEPGNTFCFITTQDNYAWILSFFFIPVGICLLAGLFFFVLSLVKLAIVAIRLYKWKEVVMPYVRVLLFIFALFFVVALFSAYLINNAANSSTISNGYAAYYGCLSGTTFTPVSQCQLDSDVSNYSLVMLKGFAISVFGILLFFIFTSQQLFLHWYHIFAAVVELARSRDKVSVVLLWNQVGSKSVTLDSISLHGVTNMTMTEDTKASPDSEESAEEQAGEEEEESGKESSSTSSSGEEA